MQPVGLTPAHPLRKVERCPPTLPAAMPSVQRSSWGRRSLPAASSSLTQEQPAHRAGLSRNQVQNIEHSRNNTKNPTTGRPGPGDARLDTVFRLASALQVEVTYLVDPQQPVTTSR